MINVVSAGYTYLSRWGQGNNKFSGQLTSHDFLSLTIWTVSARKIALTSPTSTLLKFFHQTRIKATSSVTYRETNFWLLAFVTRKKTTTIFVIIFQYLCMILLKIVFRGMSLVPSLSVLSLDKITVSLWSLEHRWLYNSNNNHFKSFKQWFERCCFCC